MTPYTTHKGAARFLGTLVLSVFLFGSTSGPLRTCLSHPVHTSGHHSTELVTEHMAAHSTAPTDDRVPPPSHEGCSCLGQCCLEHAPYLPSAGPPALAHVPIAPEALSARRDFPRKQQDRFGLPLARPPPAVV